MATEEFGRFFGLSVRQDELEAEEEWGVFRRGLAGEHKQENLRWHQDPVDVRDLSEVRVIVEGYPARDTVVNGLERDGSGWVFGPVPGNAAYEAELRFARDDWPLGTVIEDTGSYVTRISWPE